jgi:hypothetical protein
VIQQINENIILSNLRTLKRGLILVCLYCVIDQVPIIFTAVISGTIILLRHEVSLYSVLSPPPSPLGSTVLEGPWPPHI